MTTTLAEHQSLNGMYVLGRKARALGWPVCACPRNLDAPHRAEWLRGYREQEETP